MHHTFLHTTKIILASFALVLFVAALSSLGGFSADPVRAAAGDDVNGYAWSDNIGWISFNDGNVNVNEEASGAFSGYAWSDNIGWINFAPDASGAPESPKTGVFVDLAAAGDSKPVTGWARACSVFQVGCAGLLKSDIVRGGWDGWIKMSGTSPTYGVTLDTTTNTFSGFAWGDIIPGWIDMSGVAYGGTITPPPSAMPTVCFVGADSVCRNNVDISVAAGGSADISWRIEDLLGASCTVNNSSSIASAWGVDTVSYNPLTGTETITGINAPQTYELSCAVGSGTVYSATASINLNPFINYFRVNGLPSDTIFIGESATLSWEVANTVAGDSCEINPGAIVADISSCDGRLCGDSTTVSPVTNTTYTLSCEHSNDTSFGAADVIIFAHPLGFFLKAKDDQNKIKITSVGRIGGSSVGTGGISTKAIIEIHADTSFVDAVNFSIADTGHPFLSNIPTVPKSIYKFRSVPLTEGGCGATVLEGDAGAGINVGSSYFWNNDCGIEFWVETTAPLPPLSNSEIIITGTDTNSANGTAAPDNLSIFLDSRLFDPEYREF